MGYPSNNIWNPNNVSFLDKNVIKLKLNSKGCSEIFTKQNFDYGDYLFMIEGSHNIISPSTVLGIFLYEDDLNVVNIDIAK